MTAAPDFGEAVAQALVAPFHEAAANAAMLRERGYPEAADRMVAAALEAFEPITDLLAYLEGEMTQADYDARQATRDAADLAARVERYGDEGPWELDCEDCGRALTYDPDDNWFDPGPPPLYPQCSDLGEECDADDDEAPE